MDIYLYDNFDQVGLIDTSKSYFFTSNYNKVGDFSFVVKANSPYANKIKRNMTVRYGTNNKKTGIIKQIEIKRNTNGEIEKVISGKTLGNIIGNFVIVPNGEYDQIENTVEDIILHYVNKNVRGIPQFVTSESNHLGAVLRWKARYQNLKEQVETISDLYDMGWIVIINPKEETWEFKVYEGKDLSASQTGNSPVILSHENDNILIDNHIESEMAEKNFAFVAGKGEGVNRHIIEVDDIEDNERKEVFIEVNPDSEEYIDIKEQGKRALIGYKATNTITGQLKDSIFIYDRDYSLGDTVTIRDKEMDINLDLRLTSVTESYDENEGTIIFGTFGDKQAGIADVIKQELKVFEPYRYK